jgi:hypothetical protein
MNKQSDRIKNWRERQKTEGKTSVTVLISQEVREFLAEEKKTTGDNYSVIVEKAIQTLKSYNYRLPNRKHFSKREDILPRGSTKDHQPSVIPITIHEDGGQPKILIDDTTNYPSQRETEREKAGENLNGTNDHKLKEGLLNRLFRSSEVSFSRKKKWFK